MIDWMMWATGWFLTGWFDLVRVAGWVYFWGWW